ncbi:MAG: LacI family DNA-binding transcriptional regulator [Ignavibacteriaceae bacterium]|nr:LacI family DNA-binding transcriptional regulator [Ignavibacteriaceae bacterium]
MSPTIKQIASIAKVSIATVSRVLNNDKRVTEKTRKKILKITEELNYRPNIIARNFVKKKSNLIGLILPEISDEFFTEIIKGVDELTFAHGYYTLVASSHKYESLDQEIETFLRNGLVGGIIILVSSLNDKIKCILKDSRIPVVLISGGSNIDGFDAVSIENYGGAFKMTEYLILKRKYKNLLHITGPQDNDDALLRRKGFEDACKKYNAAFRIEFGEFTQESGRKICDKLLKSNSLPDVIFAANDMMAIGCYDSIKAKGLTIPDDISVVGFDDVFVSKYISPPLTTVKVQIEDVGKTAAEILMRKVREKNNHKKIISKISTKVIIRNS